MSKSLRNVKYSSSPAALLAERLDEGTFAQGPRETYHGVTVPFLWGSGLFFRQWVLGLKLTQIRKLGKGTCIFCWSNSP